MSKGTCREVGRQGLKGGGGNQCGAREDRKARGRHGGCGGGGDKGVKE